MEPKACMGPRLVPRKDRSATDLHGTSRYSVIWVAIAIPGASCTNREASVHLHQTDLDGQTHTHTCCSHTWDLLLNPCDLPRHVFIRIFCTTRLPVPERSIRGEPMSFLRKRYLVGEQSCGSHTFPQTWLYLFCFVLFLTRLKAIIIWTLFFLKGN